MKRRDFIKAVTGLVAGMYAALVPIAKAKRSPTKVVPEMPIWYRDWLKDWEDLRLGEADYFWTETKTPPWEKLGCKDCFRECSHWDECMLILQERNSVELFNGKIVKFDTGNVGVYCAVSVEYISGNEEATVFINGKKAKKVKDGIYRV